YPYEFTRQLSWRIMPASLPTIGPGGIAVPLVNSAVDFFGLVPQEMGPPAAPVLAVRAARRAMASNPQDPNAYKLLADAYDYLWKSQERPWMLHDKTWGDVRHRPASPVVWLKQLRQVQKASALYQAHILQPKDPNLHLILGEYYSELNYVDLAVEHWTLWLNLARAAGPARGVNPDEFNKFLEG